VRLLRSIFISLCVSFVLVSGSLGQRVAIVTPDDAGASRIFATDLESELQPKLKLVDDSLARAAYDSGGFSAPYNLSVDDAKRVGAAIGCDFFVLVRSAVQRRSSFAREEYYDAYAFLFVVSSRSGRLISHPYSSQIGDKPEQASKKLLATVPAMAASVLAVMRSSAATELAEKPLPPMEEPPEDGSSDAKEFRAPVPFRRLKPEYTALAELYGVTATVDITIDLDAHGQILRTEIARWAGYDLDESVDKAVRSMNWRPAERGGKFIPMRFLVRYNFIKPDKGNNTLVGLYKSSHSRRLCG
jgi:hypothetical protein